MSRPSGRLDREVRIDLAAIRRNVERLVRFAAPAEVMTVVKADGFGHGAIPVAEAALAGGASRLGVAHISEALALRRAGVDAPILAWLHTPGSDFHGAVAAEIALGVSSVEELRLVAVAARRVGRRAAVHLKVDTGLGRNGAMPADVPELVTEAARATADGRIMVEGMFSHLSAAEDPVRDPLTDAQRDALLAAVEQARAAGLRPDFVHLANTAATLRRRDLHLDLVRVGLGTYGLSPLPPGVTSSVRLEPALSMHAALATVKTLPPGHGVSYGARFVTERPTRVGVVPAGYGDGLPRTAVGMSVDIGGRPYPVLGVIAMDQLIVDLAPVSGEPEPRPGDEVTLISRSGANTVDAWARAAGTINYEVVTRLTARAPRRYV